MSDLDDIEEINIGPGRVGRQYKSQASRRRAADYYSGKRDRGGARGRAKSAVSPHRKKTTVTLPTVTALTSRDICGND